jgi:hypothetical protein
MLYIEGAFACVEKTFAVLRVLCTMAIESRGPWTKSPSVDKVEVH